MAAQFETFEHGADIGIRGFGSSLKEAFENTAIALYSVMVNIDAVEPKEKMTVRVSAPDDAFLLIEWLNALLSTSDIECMVFSRFEVKIDGTILHGTAWGEELDRERHKPKVEVKGATLHQLSVREQNGVYIAQCVVDV